MMKIPRIVAIFCGVLVPALTLSFFAHAQESQTNLLGLIQTNVPSGRPDLLTASSLRTVLNQIVLSQITAGDTCPSSALTPFQFWANTSSAPSTTLNVFDGAQCVPWATLNQATHSIGLNLSGTSNFTGPFEIGGTSVNTSVSATQYAAVKIDNSTITLNGSNQLQALGAASCTSANNVGFVGDGSTPNDTAFGNWWSSLPNSGGCLEFGVGTYLFDDQVADTMYNGSSTITLKGLGSGLTKLYWPNASGGLKITAGNINNSFHIRDMTITTAQVNSGTGIYLIGANANGDSPQSDLTNVSVSGNDLVAGSGSSSDYWGNAIHIHSWSNVAIEGVNTYGPWQSPGSAGGGIGLIFEGDTGSLNYATILNIHASSFNSHVYGLELNSYWQGVTCDTCNFNGEVGSAAIIVPSSQTGTLSLLNITNSQFNYASNQISLNTTVNDVKAIGNTITVYSNSSIGLLAARCGFLNVTGNFFNTSGSPTSTYGVVTTCLYGSITNNVFAGVAAGINLESGSYGIVAALNSYDSVSTKIINNGSSNSVGTASLGNMTGIVP